MSKKITGITLHPLYSVWKNMINRCYNEKNRSYKDYGGRGIKICEKWLGEDGFRNFAEDMGPRPEGYSIDRIDNNGNYEPGNCRWATSKQQGRNTRKNKIITYDGKTMTASAWAEFLGINPQLIYIRLKHGWPLSSVLSSKKKVIYTDCPGANKRGKLITFQGQTKTVKEWSIYLNININTLVKRFKKGWPLETVLSNNRYKSGVRSDNKVLTKKTIFNYPRKRKKSAN